VEQFKYHWRPGKDNLADYWTKHHPANLISNNSKAMTMMGKAIAGRAKVARAA
jgi:hypothetical protein